MRAVCMYVSVMIIHLINETQGPKTILRWVEGFDRSLLPPPPDNSSRSHPVITYTLPIFTHLGKDFSFYFFLHSFDLVGFAA